MRYTLPPSWSKLRFCDVAQVITGSTPPTSDQTSYGGDLPFITPGELDTAQPITEASTTLSTLGESKARVIPEGAVLVCCIASLGKVGITGCKAAFNQQINALVFDRTRVEPRYGYHYCRTLKPILEHMAPSTTVAIVNKSRFQELHIPLPPLEEQRRIAAILDKADAVRRKRKEAIALTEELLRSAFLEIFGDPATNPKGWEVVDLGNHLSFVTSGPRGWAKYYSDNGERFIRSLDVRMNFISDSDAVFVNAPNNSEAKRARVEDGDVLLTMTGSRIGRVAPVPKGFGTAYISQHVSILRPRQTISPQYLSFFLSTSSGGQRQIASMQYGQTKPGLNLNQVCSFQVPLPPMEKQLHFDAFWLCYQSALTNQTTALTRDEYLFNSLLQRAFQGEL
ncbi:MAG: restriction endonuclease subunit S [Nostoc sp. NMS2]|nr:restriction endonuclease subunit S [Nostoc sp. NMS2]